MIFRFILNGKFWVYLLIFFLFFVLIPAFYWSFSFHLDLWNPVLVRFYNVILGLPSQGPWLVSLIFGHETISELFHLLRPAACSNLCFKGVVSIVSLSACTEHHPKPLASGLTRASQVTWRTCVSSNPQEPISGFHHQQVSGFDQMYSFVSQFCGYPCLIFKTGSAFFFLISAFYL